MAGIKELEKLASPTERADEEIASPTESMSAILLAAEEKLGEYYNRTSDAYYAATLLNQAMKMEYYKKGSGSHHVTTDHVTDAMLGVMRKFQSAHPSLHAAALVQPTARARKTTNGGMADVIRQIMPEVPSTLENELNAYLA